MTEITGIHLKLSDFAKRLEIDQTQLVSLGMKPEEKLLGVILGPFYKASCYLIISYLVSASRCFSFWELLLKSWSSAYKAIEESTLFLKADFKGLIFPQNICFSFQKAFSFFGICFTLQIYANITNLSF